MKRQLIAFSIVLCLTADAGAQEWTRFRGPNGSGISAATTVPTTWTSDDYNWAIDLPGTGVSSPVIWGNRVFVTSADEDAGERHLLCIDAGSGEITWRHAFPFAKHKKHKVNTFATGTPACDDDHVYVCWQSSQESDLYAFDHQGQEKWKFSFGAFSGGHGPGASPIVFEDLVILCHDHEGPSYRVAVNRMTGEKRWSVERPGPRACYATPVVYRSKAGEAEIICTHSYEGITSINPVTGTINWDIKPFGTFKQRAIGSPIVVGDLVIAGSGFTTAERNVVAVRPETTGAGVVGTEIYRVTRGAPHIPTPLEFEGLLFLWDDTGIITCVDVQDGRKIWQKRIGGTYFGSPVCVNGKLYCMDRDGVVVVVAAAEIFEELGRVELGDPTFATPAIADGVMYLRTESKLFSIGGK